MTFADLIDKHWESIGAAISMSPLLLITFALVWVSIRGLFD